MSYQDHLSDDQFKSYKYKPAQEEGRYAQKWLGTRKGSKWMDSIRNRDSFRHPNPGQSGFFSIKDDNETEPIDRVEGLEHFWSTVDPAYTEQEPRAWTRHP